jgi:serpin B
MNKKNILITLIVLLVLILGDVSIHLITSAQLEKKDPSKTGSKEKHDYESTNNKEEFAFNIAKVTNKYQNSNYLISPYSIEIALNMLGEGANGNTKTEIYNILPSQYQNVSLAKSRISIANALFIKNEYKKYINESYYSNIKNNYNAEIIYDNFSTPKKINEWVNKKTYEMIPKILDSISKDFVLGMANALAIDVQWRYQFECNNTRNEAFIKSDGTEINVEMMNNEIVKSKDIQYIKNDDLEGILLPYLAYDAEGNEVYNDDSNHLEFIAIKPNENIFTYMSKFDNEKYEKINREFKSGEEVAIDLALPRFAYDFDLDKFMDILKEMGIKEVFNPNGADLTGIMSRENMNKIGNLYVSEAIHKTHIDLNEKGTKAAAVTYFGISKNSSIVTPDYKVVSIRFDKPFLYMIRDNKTKEILFLGVVDKPNEWKGTTCDKKIRIK